jgi:hypothetical protein
MTACVGDHTDVMSVLRSRSVLLVTVLGVLLALMVGACGPSATAVHSTLPPRPTPIDGGNVLGPPAAGQSNGPRPSVTPPPGGIAQAMTSFPVAQAYDVVGMAATATGYIAIGDSSADLSQEGPSNGVIWTSTDGMTWTQAVDPAFVDIEPLQVVANGSDVYLFGYYSGCSGDTEECQDGTEGTVVFRSSSGGAWQQLQQTPDIAAATFDNVRVWGDKLVAWGEAGDDNGTTTLWTSPDATTWTATQNIAGMQGIDSAAPGGPGLVVFGTTYDENTDAAPIVGATSADGLTFANASVPAVSDANVYDLVAGNGGMAGVGSAISDTAPSVGFALWSSDGINWSQATPSDNSFEDADIDDVYATANGYVAVGSTVGDADVTKLNGRVWVSADGRSWHSLGQFGGTFDQLSASAFGPAGLVIVTSDQLETDDENGDVVTSLHGWFMPASSLTP